MCIRDREQRARVTRLGSLIHLATTVAYADTAKPAELARFAETNVLATLSSKVVDIIISTPSQIDQLLAQKEKKDIFDVNPKTVVLTEADLMLGDLGVGKTTKSVLRRFLGRRTAELRAVNPSRQFILCSASLPEKLEGYSAKETLSNWIPNLRVFESEYFQRINPNIKHNIIRCSDGSRERLSTLLETINSTQAQKIIVFCQVGATADQIAGYLRTNKIQTAAYHSNLSAEERMEAILTFQSEEGPRILVSTDLGSRGLNFPKVNHVIQYDYALNPMHLLHRIGRLRCFDNSGYVTSFVHLDDEKVAKDFESFCLSQEHLPSNHTNLYDLSLIHI
eukprot:TRINITY_DN8718_c0_g1_i3.p1 TRINITY_DN8718_c0_g1~~TRINITY_DN8718_c0_g1_i3.p1  ORF type:complete len:359 (-),score=57.08 TRINITY_DN8718_c0_g1_i3:62-1069(-)